MPHSMKMAPGSLTLSRGARIVLTLSASTVGLGFLWCAIMLFIVGMYCFDGELFARLSDWRANAPDCYLVSLDIWVSPHAWVLCQLGLALAMSLVAQVAAYGWLRQRRWAVPCSQCLTVLGGLYLLDLACYLPEFRVHCAGVFIVLLCFTAGCLALRARSRHR